MKHLLRLTLPVCLLIVVGCGRSGLPTIDVVGTVKLDGVPVEGALVFFRPVNPASRSASGPTDANGRYKLTTLLYGDGVLAGKYRVEISKYEVETLDENLGSSDGDDDEALDEIYTALDNFDTEGAISMRLIAKRFCMAETSGLTAEVKPDIGENEISFEVTSE